MKPTTRSSQSTIVGPAVTRLPPNVLSLIFSHCCNIPKIPASFMQTIISGFHHYGFYSLNTLSRVCRAWTGPAQSLLTQSIQLESRTVAEKALKGSLLGKYPTEVVTIVGRGKKDTKLTGEQAEQILNTIHGPGSPSVDSLTAGRPDDREGTPVADHWATDSAADLTYLDLHAPIHIPPKKVNAIACPDEIPLKTLILGSDAQPAAFLTQLFTAAKSTLERLELYISKTTTPSLAPAFPIVASTIRDLTLCGVSSSLSPFARSSSPAEERTFIRLLGLCTNVRCFAWRDEPFELLPSVVGALPEAGARLVALDPGYVGSGRGHAFARVVLERPGLASLRTIMSTGWTSLPMEGRKACLDRRITVANGRQG